MLSAMTPTPNLGSVLAGWGKWSQQRGLNSRPSIYKTAALPLCYAGAPKLTFFSPHPLRERIKGTVIIPIFFVLKSLSLTQSVLAFLESCSSFLIDFSQKM